MNALGWAAAVVIGGGGSVLRFLVDGAVGSRARGPFPAGTFAVNISGAVALGALTGLALDHDAALLAGTAGVGSYTTFSTWLLESQRLGEEREPAHLAANLFLSLVLGVSGAALGRWIGQGL